MLNPYADVYMRQKSPYKGNSKTLPLSHNRLHFLFLLHSPSPSKKTTRLRSIALLLTRNLGFLKKLSLPSISQEIFCLDSEIGALLFVPFYVLHRDPIESITIRDGENDLCESNDRLSFLYR